MPENLVMDDSRLLLTDAAWERIAAVVRDVKSPAGAPPQLSDRDFVEAILYLARTGIPWRDLPSRFGAWDAVYQRFRRWEKTGIWKALFERLPDDLQTVEVLFFDSTIIRAHAHAAGAPGQKGGNKPRPWAVAGAGLAPNCIWRRPMNARRSRRC
jgi:putative transposase